MIKNWSVYQQAIFEDVRIGAGHSVVEALAGSGKCLGFGTEILMFDGTIKTVQNIIPGDLLMGPDSKPRTVLTTTVGRGNLNKIIPVKGDSWICNDEHILTLQGTNYKKGQIKDIALCDFLNDPRRDRDWKLFRVPVSFSEKKLEFDPYLLGLWIGDGTLSKTDITSADQEIIDYCVKIASVYGLEAILRKEKSKAYNIRFRAKSRGKKGIYIRNVLFRFLNEKCKIINKKIIPEDYLINSEENRLKLLAGLLDTDGYYHTGCYELVTVDLGLAKQYCFLARSLGFAAYCSVKNTSIKKNSFKGKAYRINISGDVNRIPCLIKRKQASVRKQNKRVTCTGFTVESIGIGNYYGFTLDGDGRFLLADFTVTHNTSSIIEALKYIPSGNSWLLVAFNKKIAEELKERSPFGGDISTLHSLGLKSLYKTISKLTVDQDKVDNILIKMFGKKKDNKEVFYALSKAVSLSKGYLAHTAKEIDDVLDEHDVECGALERQEFINHVLFILDICKKQTDKVDFDDMVWLPNVIKSNVPKYDRVFVDEAQDMNKSQMGLVLQAIKPNGRITIIGDPKQAIYGFRGADSQAMSNMQKQLDAKILNLPITYRCPLSVVREAQKLVPNLQAAPNAIEGKVQYISMTEMKKMAKPGCFILSRTNAPLVSLVFAFLKQGIPANIQGKDLGNNLLNMVKSSKAKTIDKFQAYLAKWSAREIKRLTTAEKDFEHVTDKMECFNALMENCKSITDLKSTIDKLFSDTDDHSRIVLSSTHRAKGMERNVVYMLLGTYRMTNQEEKNIKYVGISRSAKELYFVLSDKKVSEWEDKNS